MMRELQNVSRDQNSMTRELFYLSRDQLFLEKAEEPMSE